jgi:transposase
MKEGTITLSIKELDRLKLVHEVEQGYISGVEAAKALGISTRQFKRIRRRHREKGDRGLAHRLRGRPSNRGIPLELRDKVIAIIRQKYPDFGPTFASEKLEERHGIKLSGEAVRKLMISAGLWKTRKRKERHRVRRERRECFGELVQIDGSDHDWLEGRGEKMSLMAMIDDATSRVIARFFPSESTASVMETMRLWLDVYGRPRAVYTDRHSIWVSMSGEAGERDEGENTQMRRALKELNIDFIPARSPQAKGRVERLFETLQDRLVKELRLAKIDNIDGANRFLDEVYLPAHNRRFAVEPVRKADSHRRLGPGFDLDLILSKREERVVQNDYTIRWHNRIFQIGKPVYPGLRGGHVEVAVKLDGTMEILFGGRKLKWHEIIDSTDKSTYEHTSPGGGIEKESSPARKKWIPPKDHPWRKYQPGLT